MGGWWLSRIEHRCACPSWEQYQAIKRLVHAGDEMDGAVLEINAAKGTERRDSPQGSNTSWFQWPRGAHSAKPEAFLDLVEQVSPGPYLEMFARRARFGWDYWGDESLGTATLEAS
jgi:N6-adenosine-specific RNA methylase IME4